MFEHKSVQDIKNFIQFFHLKYLNLENNHLSVCFELESAFHLFVEAERPLSKNARKF